jgi:hypothetical protein
VSKCGGGLFPRALPDLLSKSITAHLGMLGKEASINSINIIAWLSCDQNVKNATNTLGTNVLHSAKNTNAGRLAGELGGGGDRLLCLWCCFVLGSPSQRCRWPTVRTWRRVRWLCCAVVWWATRKQEHGVYAYQDTASWWWSRGRQTRARRCASRVLRSTRRRRGSSR